MTISDYEVQLQPKGGSGVIKIVVRASSHDDARRQALAQYPKSYCRKLCLMGS